MNTCLNNKLEYWGVRLTWISLLLLAMGIFTSITFSTLSHLFILFPAFYFAYKDFSFKNLSKSWISLFFLILIILASILFNRSNINDPLHLSMKTKYFILALLGVFAYRAMFKIFLNDKKKKYLLHVFLIVTTLATLSGIIAVYTGFNFLRWKEACHPTRACGLYGMYMTYGYGISLFMTLLTGMFIYRKKINHIISKNFIVVIWMINLLGLFLSYSRGAWIGFVISIPFFFLKVRRLFCACFACIGIVILLSFFFSEKVQETFLSPRRITSNLERISLWQAAVKAFQENPVLGKGHRQFEAESRRIKEQYDLPYKQFGGNAHNNFMEHLASTGLLGLIMLFLFHIFWFKEMYKRDDILASIVGPFIISFFISGQFQYTFGDGENLFLIMAVWALSQVDQ